MKKLFNLILLPILSIGFLSCCHPSGKSPNEFSFTYKTRFQNKEENAFYFSKENTFTFNFEDFVNEDPTKYNNKISTFNLLLNLDSYAGESGVYVKNQDKFINDGSTTYFARCFNVKDITTINLAENDYTEDLDDVENLIYFHYDFSYKGKDYQVFTLLLRGTDGSFGEWKSNFDIGYDNSIYINDDHPHTDWKNRKLHKGFDTACNRSYETFKEYYLSKRNTSATQILNLTGHSRGAALTNIFAKKYNDFNVKTFAYSFATPNTTTDADDLDCPYLFNIINKGDMVTCVPSNGVGFYRYGTDVEFDGIDFKNNFGEYFSNKLEYNNANTTAVNNLLKDLLVDIKLVYAQPSIDGRLSFDSYDEAHEFISDKKEIIDEFNETYCLSLILNDSIIEEDGEYIVTYKYNRALNINALLSGFDMRVDFLLDLLPFLDDLLAKASEYVPQILEKGMLSIRVSHMPHIYLLYLLSK